MDFLEQNLAVLARRQPGLARLLRTATLSRIELVPSRKGPPTCFYRHSASDPVPLHSRYDPLQEARQSLKNIDLTDPDYFVFLGFGLGYGLDALLEEVPQDQTHVFIVESDLEILRAAFTARDLTSFLSLPHIHFAWPPEGNELGQQWERFFDLVRARNSVYVNHPPSLLLNPELFKFAANVIKSKTLQIFADINSMVASSQVFLANFVANFGRALSAPGVKAFARAFADVPAILVSAGPSLDRNIHELHTFQNRILILATDTALKPLLASGIEPHFVLSGDPRHENYLHLEGSTTHEALLVTEATAHPETLRAFDGRTVICTFENSTLRTLSDIFAPKGTMRAWGSVATMCLDFALLTGCNPVIFVGQDLAFSDGRTYCSGLHWERDWFAGVRSPEEWQEKWADIRSRNKTVMTEDIFGRPAESTDKLMAYWNWISAEIEKHPGIRFINATEGGILRHHIEIVSLREALHRFCRDERDLKSSIRRVFADAALGEPNVDLSILASLNEEFRQFQEILERGFSLCSDAQTHLPIRELTTQLDQVRISVCQMTKLAPLLDCFNQMGNVTFLRRQTPSSFPSKTSLTADELRETYLEYFQSLSHASRIIAEGLSRLPQIQPEG